MAGSSRADDPMLVRTPDMGSLRSALAGRFTIGTHDICRSLQCSRTWFQKNVKPHLHYVFITTNGIRALRDYELVDKAGEPCLDQCWYDEAEFRDFIDRHTVIERRTKVVIAENLVDDLRACRRAVSRALAALPAEAPRSARAAARELAVAAHLGSLGSECWERQASPARRGELAWLPAPDRATALEAFGPGFGWRTVPHMTGYGDSAELVYRRLFAAGDWRCTIEIPRAGEEPTRHVMYCRDPFPDAPPDGVSAGECTPMIVPAAVWGDRL